MPNLKATNSSLFIKFYPDDSVELEYSSSLALRGLIQEGKLLYGDKWFYFQAVHKGKEMETYAISAIKTEKRFNLSLAKVAVAYKALENMNRKQRKAVEQGIMWLGMFGAWQTNITYRVVKV